jgi:flagellar biosynthesis/type III secretory pathway chaperone
LDWQKLINALSEEKAVCQELIALAEEKKDAVLQKNIEQLDSVVRREQGAVMRLGHWEKQRISCLETPKDHPGSPTLLFFAETAPSPEREVLRALHKDLSALIETLRSANAENKAMIESRLEYVRFVLDMLNEDQTSGVYSAGGASSYSSGSQKILDKKV